MSALSKLGKSQAVLPVLVTLNQSKRPLIHAELTRKLKSDYKLGRSSVESAVDACIELSLIKRELKRAGTNPLPSLFHSLTPKGVKIAELALEIDKVLSQKT
ncbi:MAG: hypothetical protein M1167_08010 [Chloroflexi bacterium]|nr:hypothetical protein [Chloroflexota bacterium]